MERRDWSVRFAWIRVRLEHVSEYKYLGCVFNEPGTDEAECRRKWRVGGKLQILLGLWLMIGVSSLIVLMSCMNHCSCLFLGMVVRQ